MLTPNTHIECGARTRGPSKCGSGSETQGTVPVGTKYGTYSYRYLFCLNILHHVPQFWAPVGRYGNYVVKQKPLPFIELEKVGTQKEPNDRYRYL